MNSQSDLFRGGLGSNSSLWSFQQNFSFAAAHVPTTMSGVLAAQNASSSFGKDRSSAFIPAEFIEEVEEGAPVGETEVKLEGGVSVKRERGRKESEEEEAVVAAALAMREEDDDEDAPVDDDGGGLFHPGQPSAGAAAPGVARERPAKRQVVDITEYLCLPQSDAAVKLGLPVSTLSKRWKEAARNRKWPYRKVSKIDKEIATLLQLVPTTGPNAGVLTGDIENQLRPLLRQRQEELRHVSIRL